MHLRDEKMHFSIRKMHFSDQKVHFSGEKTPFFGRSLWDMWVKNPDVHKYVHWIYVEHRSFPVAWRYFHSTTTTTTTVLNHVQIRSDQIRSDQIINDVVGGGLHGPAYPPES